MSATRKPPFRAIKLGAGRYAVGRPGYPAVARHLTTEKAAVGEAVALNALVKRASEVAK